MSEKWSHAPASCFTGVEAKLSSTSEYQQSQRLWVPENRGRRSQEFKHWRLKVISDTDFPALRLCPGAAMQPRRGIQGQPAPFSACGRHDRWPLSLWVIRLFHLHVIQCHFLLWNVCLGEPGMYSQVFGGAWGEVRSTHERKCGG